MVKLYVLNDDSAYYYTPVYFTLDRDKIEKLKKELNDHEVKKNHEYLRIHSPDFELNYFETYTIIEEELDKPKEYLFIDD